jgi:hypothetical protein
MIGDRIALSTTVDTCTTIVGLTIPVPLNAEPMEMSAN